MKEMASENLRPVPVEDQHTNDVDEVLRAIRQIIHAVDVQSKRLVRETGLSAPQYVVLKAIDRLGEESTTRAIARHVSLSQATITKLMDRLEEKELVTRHRSPRDRRIVHTKLTAEGTARLDDAPPMLQDQFVKTFENLPYERRETIITALSDVARMMGADDVRVEPVLTTVPPGAKD